MASSSPVPRSHSRNSFYSTTTYHSFQDVELYEPTLDSRATGLGLSGKEAPVRRLRPSRRDDVDSQPASFQMVRQDSGYESSTPPPRNSQSSRRPRLSSSKHASSSSSSSPPRPASQTRVASARAPKRPSLRRAAATGPISHLPARSSLTIPRSQSHQLPPHTVQRKHSYFQFPSPDNLLDEDPPQHHHQQQQQQTQSQRPRSRPSVDLAPVILTVNTANENSNRSPNPNHHPTTTTSSSSSRPCSSSSSSCPHAHADPHAAPLPLESPVSPYAPPQTTHYWTSDRTRRLEYAAIDAASRGVRGWVMRNMVPECFVPQERRRVGFDDDTGSVRRYRLDLEIECPEESVPPSPVGEKPRGFRARAAGGSGGRRSWWARWRGCA